MGGPAPALTLYCVLWVECALHTHSYDEMLTPNVMLLEGGAFGRSFIHAGGVLTNGISILIKEAPENSPPLPPREDTVRREPSINQEVDAPQMGMPNLPEP